jgi:hypothetical protein
MLQHFTEPAFVIAWSAWRRAHQAIAQASQRKRVPLLLLKHQRAIAPIGIGTPL